MNSIIQCEDIFDKQNICSFLESVFKKSVNCKCEEDNFFITESTSCLLVLIFKKPVKINIEKSVTIADKNINGN